MILPYQSVTSRVGGGARSSNRGDATAAATALTMSGFAFAAWLGAGVIELENVVRAVGLAAFVVLFVAAASAWVVGMIVGCFELAAAARARYTGRYRVALASLVLSLLAPPAGILLSFITH